MRAAGPVSSRTSDAAMPKRIPSDAARVHSAAGLQCPPNATGSTEETVVPVVQEELNVGTRRVETDAGVRVRKTVAKKVQVIDEPLVKDELDVERVAVDRYVDKPVAVRYEGDTMIVPVLEEVLVVQKRLLLKEEVRITRRRSEHRAPQRVSLRAEHVEVERFGDGETQAVADPRAPDPPLDPACRPAAPRTEVPEAHRSGEESLIERRRRAEEEQRSQLARTPR
jgi:uncharacterized protein (TIGR02271 family)